MPVLKKNIPASSLIETIVAMIIVLIGYLSGTMVYSSILKSSNFGNRLKALVEVEKVYENSLRTRSVIDETLEYEQFKIIKEVKAYAGTGELSVFTVKAVNNKNKTLFELHEIIDTK